MILFRSLSLGLLLSLAASCLADSLEMQPIPFNPGLQKKAPAEKPAAETEKKTPNSNNNTSAKSAAPEQAFTYVGIDAFFQSLQFCGQGTAVSSNVIDGKIFSEKNNVCHFSVTPKQTNLHMDCYLPMEVLLDVFTTPADPDEGGTNEPSNLTEEDNNDIQDSMAAKQFYSKANQIMLYCQTTGTETKVDQLKSTFEGNDNAPN